MSTPRTPAESKHRLITYALFAGLVISGLVLEKQLHEMHVSKMLIFASFGVWARELRGPMRWAMVTMSGLLCLMILVSWFTFRHQHLVPLGNGAYRISNNPDPTK